MQMRRLIDEEQLESQELRPPLRLLSSSMSAEQWTILRRASVAASSSLTTTPTTAMATTTTLTALGQASNDARMARVLRLNGYGVRGTQTLELTHVPACGTTAVSPLADLLQLLSLLVDEQLRGIRETPRTRSALIQLRHRLAQQNVVEQQRSPNDIVDSLKSSTAALASSSSLVKYGQTLCVSLPLSSVQNE
jgi:hypothetical protein